jgi:GNAT superfamily N-acetyltransferase
MASIDAGVAPVVRRLTVDDVPGALQLSIVAGWNQNEADWQMLLELGQGFGIDADTDDGSRQLAASTVALPFDRRFAWVSMVLVLPEFRRRGYARRLLGHVLARIAAKGMTAVLDATPAGREVYAKEGFADAWSFARWRREACTSPPPALQQAGPAPRPLVDADWAAISALDLPAFGADRVPLLRELAQRWPAASRVVETDGQLSGFMLGRDGREAHQIGPLLATDVTTATSLVAEALRATEGPVYLDLLDRRSEWLPWLHRLGFARQRPFTRMVFGATSAPGRTDAVFLVAGPELG